jgi:hypothetical protein
LPEDRSYAAAANSTISTDDRYRRPRVLDTLICITAALIMIICLVVIGYQRRRMSNEYRARDAAEKGIQ